MHRQSPKVIHKRHADFELIWLIIQSMLIKRRPMPTGTRRPSPVVRCRTWDREVVGSTPTPYGIWYTTSIYHKSLLCNLHIFRDHCNHCTQSNFWGDDTGWAVYMLNHCLECDKCGYELTPLYTVSQKTVQLWNGIARNDMDRFLWYLAEIFRRL